MAAQFLAGVIVGVLIGLAIAPLLRSWVVWQMIKSWRDAEPSARHTSKPASSLDGEHLRPR